MRRIKVLKAFLLSDSASSNTPTAWYGCFCSCRRFILCNVYYGPEDDLETQLDNYQVGIVDSRHRKKLSASLKPRYKLAEEYGKGKFSMSSI